MQNIINKVIVLLIVLTFMSGCGHKLPGQYELVGCDYNGLDCHNQISGLLDIDDDLNVKLKLVLKDKNSTSIGHLEDYDNNNYILHVSYINDDSCSLKFALGYDNQDTIYLKMDQNTYYIFKK